MDAILTNYPVSRNFQQRLATLITGDVLNISLTELKQRSAFKLLTHLRSLRVENLVLPAEDENGSALLPILKLVASIVPARQIYLVDADLRPQRISRLDVIGSVVRLAHASAVARTAVMRVRHEIARLLATERIAIDKVDGFEVLYLNANLWFGVKAGGSVGHISGVVNALLQTGCAVHFASAGGRLMVKDAATYIQLVPPAYFGLPQECNHYRFHFHVVQQLKQLATHRHFDFIYQRLSLANYSGVVLSRSLGIPLVLEYNGSEVWVARNWGRPLWKEALAEQIEEANLRHAHLVVTISDVLRDELLDRGVAAERIVTYPNCIDPEMFDPERFTAQEVAELRRCHGIPADAVVVTFLGTFGQWHGAEVLAQAIQQLIDNHQGWVEAKKVHFLLVGDGMKMPNVRKILGNHAQGPYVTLAGLVPQHEAPLYLASSNILCSPHVPNADGTKFFGSPTKLFEYMAMGKAIIASDLDQIGNVLRNGARLDALESAEETAEYGQVALLVEPGNVEQLVTGIQRLIDEPSLCEVLGRKARSLALERYTWRCHVHEIMNGLRMVMKPQV
jgi:glycosyltransferase involved in cell wall biosynthesis